MTDRETYDALRAKMAENDRREGHPYRGLTPEEIATYHRLNDRFRPATPASPALRRRIGL